MLLSSDLRMFGFEAKITLDYEYVPILNMFLFDSNKVHYGIFEGASFNNDLLGEGFAGFFC